MVNALTMAVAVVFGVALLAYEELDPDGPDLLISLDIVGGATACAALWWRRRRPVLVALFTTVIGSVATTAVVSSSLALLTVAIHCCPASVLGTALVSVATTPLSHLRGPMPTTWTSVIITMLLSIVLTSAVVAWGLYVRHRRQLLGSLRERAERAESEQQSRIEQARRNERARIAREMHDVLAHRMSLVSLHAGALEFRPDAAPEEIQLAAGVIRAGAHQALQELREVIGLLREDEPDPAPSRPQPTLTDVPQLVQEATEAGDRIRYRLLVSDPAAVPERIGRAAYRVVQESLTNARKHAPSAEVDLLLKGTPGDGLWIEATNEIPPGAQPATIPGAGVGLVGLSERVELAGGRLGHGSRPDRTFVLRAWLPWPV